MVGDMVTVLRGNAIFALLALLFCISGATSLVYEVLWLKQLGLLFGNTTQAAAATLTAFFLGLAVGSYHWGGRVQRYAYPLRLYGFLELAVAFCALGYFGLLYGYAWLYPFIFTYFADTPAVFTFVKFFLALILLFPPAYFMGGTLPVISQFAVRDIDELGHKLSLLYAVNTLGAVIGVFLAGFYLPIRLGYTYSYIAAMAVTSVVALTAILVGGKRQHQRSGSTPAANCSAIPGQLKFLAFISGMLTLALQVLWNRMFAQVLQNSVYTFALVLAAFLLCLAFAGAMANRLQRYIDVSLLMFAALTGGALLVSVSPFVFMWWTDGLHFIGANENWQGYLRQTALPALLIMGPALLSSGMVFPLLAKLGEGQGGRSGVVIGQLLAWNTAGAICGSLLAGFVLLDAIGLWASIRFCAVSYWLCVWYWLGQSHVAEKGWLAVPACGILLAVTLFDTGRLPVVRFDPVADGESLLQVWEGSAATVAVLRVHGELKIKVNNYYTLGGTASAELERLQGYLPLLLHERPRNVYMLGLGTGISAGGALSYPVKKLCVTELLGDVIVASEQYFGEYNNNLFYDPRARVIREDGRNYLRGSGEHFDVIISDLFVPWNAEAGGLYALEHYQEVAAHLSEHGLFMQWLPAYQLTRAEFDSIAKTMLQAFPQVTVWRGDFSALTPVIGLLGQKEKSPLSPQAWLFNSDINKEHKPFLRYFVGNLEDVRQDLQLDPINRDDYPFIEFNAPVSQRRVKAGEEQWLIGDALLALQQRLNGRSGSDAYLSQVTAQQRLLPTAGLHLQQAQWLKYQGQLQAAQRHLQLYSELIGTTAEHR